MSRPSTPAASAVMRWNFGKAVDGKSDSGRCRGRWGAASAAADFARTVSRGRRGRVVPAASARCGGELVHDAVGERVGKRDAEFEDVHARVRRRRGRVRAWRSSVRIAGADVGDEGPRARRRGESAKVVVDAVRHGKRGHAVMD